MTKSIITKEEAFEQYGLLLETNKANNSLLDKANSLRSRIETVLCIAYKNKFSVKSGKSINANTEMMINELLADNQHTRLRDRLHKARRTLNIKAMHRYLLETTKGPDINEEEYKACLSAICDFIALMSSQPIPPALRQFIKNLTFKRVSQEERLDIIFLVELYRDIRQLNDATAYMNGLERMASEKERLALSGLNIHLVTYSPEILEYSHPTSESNMNDTCNNSGITQHALDTALNTLSGTIEQWKEKGGYKPWLIWITSDLTDKPSDMQVKRMQELMDMQEMAFYPWATTKKAFDGFTSLWPCCGPYQLNPKLCGNSFKSVLNTVQLLFSHNSLAGSKQPKKMMAATGHIGNAQSSSTLQ